MLWFHYGSYIASQEKDETLDVIKCPHAPTDACIWSEILLAQQLLRLLCELKQSYFKVCRVEAMSWQDSLSGEMTAHNQINLHVLTKLFTEFLK